MNSFHLIYDEQGERSLASVAFTAGISLTPPSYGHLPYILFVNKTPRNTTGRGRGEEGFNLSHRVGSAHGTSGKFIKTGFIPSAFSEGGV